MIKEYRHFRSHFQPELDSLMHLYLISSMKKKIKLMQK